jgi:hypothetical protein
LPLWRKEKSIIPFLFDNHGFKGSPGSHHAPSGNEESWAKEDDAAWEGGDAILCKNCLHMVTAMEEKIEKSGAHAHTFVNPHGNVFEIGCFRHAPGCVYFGLMTNEFTWFKGYGWRLAGCGACAAHLGWVYISQSGEAMFHGLILSRLIELSMDDHPGP